MRKCQKGQSTIEFILTFMFALGIVFMFVNIAINYSAGYLVHYATFMASRTYLTVDSAGGNSPADSSGLAKEEALNTFKRFKMGVIGVPDDAAKNCCSLDDGFYIRGAYEGVNPSTALFVGAVSVFERPLSFFQSITGTTTGKLVSESFLGKDPVRLECWQRTCQAIMLAISGNPTACSSGSQTIDVTVFDNGC
jgi:hypothetical protein